MIWFMVKNLQQKYQKCPEIWFGFSVWHPSKEKLDTWKPIGKKWCPTSGIFFYLFGDHYIYVIAWRFIPFKQANLWWQGAQNLHKKKVVWTMKEASLPVIRVIQITIWKEIFRYLPAELSRWGIANDFIVWFFSSVILPYSDIKRILIVLRDGPFFFV